MNKTALYAIIIALMVPLAAYFFVKYKSEEKIHMPRHYLPDTVIAKTKGGKQSFDTAWHTVGDFKLTNQEGTTITWDSLKGKIVVADLFFTHCPTICPAMTANMRRLAESVNNGKRVGDKGNKLIHFLSFSIDPDRDSVPAIKHWADRFQINPEKWWLLTGNKQEIYNLAINEMKMFAEDGKGIDTNFIHSDKYILIDSNRHVRGYYSGLDSASLAQLSNDLVLLTMEKDPKAKSFFAGKLEIMAIAFLAAILGVGLLVFFIKRKN